MNAVTFDFGQTLAELDCEFLAERVAERGGQLAPARADAAMQRAWQAYGAAKTAGQEHEVAWCSFMRTLLETATVRPPSDAVAPERREVWLGELVRWLWSEQPHRNLWRRPVPGMLELVRELHATGVPLGIISNSEGRVAELVAELSATALFGVIADSGKLGFEKPQRRIFDYAAQALGVHAEDLIHVGDAWEADVIGALGAGSRAIWFSPVCDRELPPQVRHARDAKQTRAALRAFGLTIDG